MWNSILSIKLLQLMTPFSTALSYQFDIPLASSLKSMESVFLLCFPYTKKCSYSFFSDLLGYSCISYLYICDSNLLSLGSLVLAKSSLSIIKWFQNHLLIWSKFYRLRQLCFKVGGWVSEQFSSNSGVEAVCPCFILLLLIGTRKEEKGFSNCKN